MARHPQRGIGTALLEKGHLINARNTRRPSHSASEFSVTGRQEWGALAARMLRQRGPIVTLIASRASTTGSPAEDFGEADHATTLRVGRVMRVRDARLLPGELVQVVINKNRQRS